MLWRYIPQLVSTPAGTSVICFVSHKFNVNRPPQKKAHLPEALKVDFFSMSSMYKGKKTLLDAGFLFVFFTSPRPSAENHHRLEYSSKHARVNPVKTPVQKVTKHEETPRFGEVFDQRKKSKKKLNSWNPNPFVDTCCFITAINTIRSGLHIGPQAPQVWQSCQLVGHEIHPSFSVGNHTCALFGPKRFVVPLKKKKNELQ